MSDKDLSSNEKAKLRIIARRSMSDADKAEHYSKLFEAEKEPQATKPPANMNGSMARVPSEPQTFKEWMALKKRHGQLWYQSQTVQRRVLEDRKALGEGFYE